MTKLSFPVCLPLQKHSKMASPSRATPQNLRARHDSVQGSKAQDALPESDGQAQRRSLKGSLGTEKLDGELLCF